MSDAFAIDNMNGLVAGNGGIKDVAGCDGPPFGHVTVEYQIPQELFFAGVLGFDGPATVRTRATAGWGPPGAASPIPIVVYTSAFQGDCDIQTGNPEPGTQCYLWYDNDRFSQSAFGFLNLCPEGAPCRHGWDVSPGANCSNSGAAQRRDWIHGNWDYGPLNLNYPAATYVCRDSGLAEANWHDLEEHIGEDLLFPVNDCTTQVDRNGNVVPCDTAPDKYNIIGFIKFHLDDVLEQKSEWEGAGGQCQTAEIDMVPLSPNVDLDNVAPGLGCVPYDTIGNVELNAKGPGGQCCTEGTHYTYDPIDHVVDWIDGVRDRVTISWDYAEGGPCGVAPGNASAVCILVTTVEVQIGGTDPGGGADFGLRAIRLCDLEIGSCPQDS
jgi:hypothetical protein